MLVCSSPIDAKLVRHAKEGIEAMFPEAPGIGSLKLLESLESLFYSSISP